MKRKEKKYRELEWDEIKKLNTVPLCCGARVSYVTILAEISARRSLFKPSVHTYVTDPFHPLGSIYSIEQFLYLS